MWVEHSLPSACRVPYSARRPPRSTYWLVEIRVCGKLGSERSVVYHSRGMFRVECTGGKANYPRASKTKCITNHTLTTTLFLLASRPFVSAISRNGSPRTLVIALLSDMILFSLYTRQRAAASSSSLFDIFIESGVPFSAKRVLVGNQGSTGETGLNTKHENRKSGHCACAQLAPI